MDITSNRIPATPRSKYARYGNNNVSISGSSGGANIDTSNFVRLRGQTSQTIEGAIAATRDIVAYQTNPEAGDFQFPIASTDALGTIKVGSGLKINTDGTLSVDGEIGGGAPSSHTHNWEDINNVPKGNFNQYGVVKLASGGGLALYGDLLLLAPANGKQPGGVRIGSGINVTSDGTISVTTGTIGAAPSSHTHSQLHTHSNKSYLDNINQNLSTSSNVQHAQVKSTGEVIAYSTGTGTQSPFKYWKPSVSSSGVLSWTNSTSETTPSSVNIKGQGVYLQPIITQYFIDNKSEIWLLFLIAHSKR